MRDESEWVTDDRLNVWMPDDDPFGFGMWFEPEDDWEY